jgi:hypothetical protein
LPDGLDVRLQGKELKTLPPVIRSAASEEPVTATTTNVLNHLQSVNWALAKMELPEGTIMIIVKSMVSTYVTYLRSGLRSERIRLHAIPCSRLESLLYAKGAK